jgi:hypothetical protein
MVPRTDQEHPENPTNHPGQAKPLKENPDLFDVLLLRLVQSLPPRISATAD